MMGFFKKQFGKVKEGLKDEYEYKKKLRTAERKAYRESALEEAKKYGKQKAALETKQKIKSFKDRQKTARSFTFGGFAGPTQKGKQGPSVSNYLLGGSMAGNELLGIPTKKAPKKMKRKKKKSSGKQIIVKIQR